MKTDIKKSQICPISRLMLYNLGSIWYPCVFWTMSELSSPLISHVWPLLAMWEMFRPVLLWSVSDVIRGSSTASSENVFFLYVKCWDQECKNEQQILDFWFKKNVVNITHIRCSFYRYKVWIGENFEVKLHNKTTGTFKAMLKRLVHPELYIDFEHSYNRFV